MLTVQQTIIEERLIALCTAGWSTICWRVPQSIK